MNTILKLKSRLAIFSLAGLFLSNFAAAAVPSQLNEDYVLIMSVPHDAPDEVTISYTSGGMDKKETVALTEKVSMSISGLDLSEKDIPFDLFQTGEGFALDLGTHPEDSLSPVLGFLSDLSTVSPEKESTIYFGSSVPGSTLGIYQDTDKSNAEIVIDTETPVPFVQQGVLHIEFSKQEKPAVNPGEGLPESGSTGGCSLNAASNAGLGSWFLILPLALGFTVRRLRRS